MTLLLVSDRVQYVVIGLGNVLTFAIVLQQQQNVSTDKFGFQLFGKISPTLKRIHHYTS